MSALLWAAVKQPSATLKISTSRSRVCARWSHSCKCGWIGNRGGSSRLQLLPQGLNFGQLIHLMHSGGWQSGWKAHIYNDIGHHFLCNYCPKLKKFNWWPPKPQNIDIGQSFFCKQNHSKSKQARKAPSYASSKLRLTHSLTGVKCRATSVAKKMVVGGPSG